MKLRAGFFVIIFLTTSRVFGQTDDSIMLAALMKDPLNIETPDSVIKSIWIAGDNSWRYERRTSYSYNENGYKKNEILSNWQNDNWLINYETIYTYDGNNLIEQIKNWWDDYYILWLPISKHSFTYSNYNQIAQKSDFKWSQSQNDWTNDSMITYVYNDFQQLSEVNVQVWSDYFNMWENNSQTIYSYNSGNIEKQTFSIWDFDYLIWDERIITNFVYDGSNRISEKSLMTKNSLYANWVNYSKTEYTYNLNGLIESEIYFNWSIPEDNWIETYKMSYTYDNDLKLILKTVFNYDWYYMEWWNLYQTTYDYNNPSEIVATTYHWDYGQWLPLNCFNYYYPGYISILPKEPNYSMKLFPNPANEKVQIVLNKPWFGEIKIQINDLSGRVIYTNQCKTHESILEIRLPELTNGIYLINLIVEDQVITKKLIIKK